MAELAQAYVHLKPYEFSPERVRVLGDRVLADAVEIATLLYGGGITVEVTLAEGSGKFWASVHGVLVGVHIGYGVIADWKAFKEQVHEICNTAQQYGAQVCGATINEAEAKPKQVFRTERRLKTPGKLYRVMNELEKLDDMAINMPKSQVIEQVARIRWELARVEADLTTEERERLLKVLHYENLGPIKDVPPHKAIDPMPKVVLRDERDRRQRELELDFVLGAHTEPPPPRKQLYRKSQFVAGGPQISVQDTSEDLEVGTKKPIQDLFS